MDVKRLVHKNVDKLPSKLIIGWLLYFNFPLDDGEAAAAIDPNPIVLGKCHSCCNRSKLATPILLNI